MSLGLQQYGDDAHDTDYQPSYKYERLTRESVEEVIESYKKMNWWP